MHVSLLGLTVCMDQHNTVTHIKHLHCLQQHQLLLSVLQELLVHCETQVLQFVSNYLQSTQIDPDSVRSICKEVRG